MPKQLGGLGVTDLHCMNISLLLKWGWKLKDPTYNFIWKKFLQVKYTALTPCSKMPLIWKEIMALSQLGQTGRAVILGNDKKYHLAR
jgi:hypothetical protein